MATVGSLDRVFVLLMLAFLVVPIIELYLFVQVSGAIGFGWALFWIVAVSVIGASLVKREGMGALRRANEKVTQGQVPTDELINGILIVVAGALMLTPGFLTDIVGLLLLLPPTRALLRVSLRSRFAAGPIVVGGFRRVTNTGQTGDPFGRDPFGRDPFGRSGDDVMDAESWEDPPGDDTGRRELG